MDVIGATMTVARQPETGRNCPSDRCPVASDGRGEGRREKGKGKERGNFWECLLAFQ